MKSFRAKMPQLGERSYWAMKTLVIIGDVTIGD